MIPKETENYNETVLIPVLQDRVSVLTNQTILLEAKLKIAEKQKDEIQKQLDEALQAKSEPTGEQNPE
ncbi:hypothetical protein FJZ55_00790 [Candidatus Woesearchaeota archaeon]|nr:hypothetical protein [Candidatus Woesearchaeota archaeon]